MSEIIDALVLDMIEWIDKEPRSYADVMDAWRTSCPRLTVWEDAVDGGLVERRRSADGIVVVATARGRALLAVKRRPAAMAHKQVAKAAVATAI